MRTGRGAPGALNPARKTARALAPPGQKCVGVGALF